MILICIWMPAALLTSTRWTRDLDLAELLALLGVMAGLLIGRTQLSPTKAFLGFLVVSIILPLWLFTLRLTPEGDFFIRIAYLGQRSKLAFAQAISGQPVQDPVIFIMFCAVFFWIIGYFTGFGFTRQHNPWHGLLTAAGIFGVINFYSRSQTSSIWIGASLIFLMFLLASRLFWLERKREWDQAGYLVERDAGESILRLASVLGIVLVLLAWNLEFIIRSFTPGTSEYERVSEFWKGIQSSLQNNFVGLQSDTSLTGVYPGGMRMGNQTPTDPSPAFLVEMLAEPSPRPKYYWRVKTYYEYRNGQWHSPQFTDDDSALFKPEEYGGSNRLTKLETRYFWQSADGSVIPYTGRYAGSNLPFRLEVISKPVPVTGDVLAYPLDLLKPGSIFQLESAVFSGNLSDLQNPIYSQPSKIAAYSLQLPESVPQRVKDLGIELAQGQTMVERVMNVTRYLRTQITYKNRISTPPSGRDPVDWFLFEKKEGFCTYYASAEVVLLRAAGIPARLAVGYSQGERMENTYLIKLNDAHAWPEVYFPGVGWLPFEPTVVETEPLYSTPPTNENQDVNRDLSPEERRGNQNAPVPQTDTGEPDSNEQNSQPVHWLVYSLVILSIVLIVVLFWLFIGRRRWKKLPRIPSILLKWLKFLRLPVPDWLAWWDWYSGLSELAVRYYWIEKLALISGFVSKKPGTPGELMRALYVSLPASKDNIIHFHTGLYYDLYSQNPDKHLRESRAAGAALLKELVAGIFRKQIQRFSM